MNSAQQYIELYKKLETVVRDAYKLKNETSISYYLSKHDKFRRYRNEIKYCQDVRNLLQHNQKISDNFPVNPSKEMIKFIERLIDTILNRPQCKDIAITLGNIYYKSMEDQIGEAMTKMRKNNYTHIPILENGVVIGVFDENSIFNYLAKEEIIAIENTKFLDLEEYLSIHDRELVAFSFTSPDVYVEDLYELFRRKLNKGIRVGMIFVTPSGKKTEKLTGIITPWDILGKDNI